MKRILSILTLLLLSLSICAYDFEVNGIYYNVIGDNEVEVTRNNDYSIYSGEISIPEKVEYNGNVYKVTTLGSWSLAYCDIESIIIPNSVTIICDNAFKDSNLKSVIMPNHLTSIGDYAFNFSLNLNCSITLPNTVTTIGKKAFRSTKLSAVISLNTVPPKVSESFCYIADGYDYIHCPTLYVPKGCKTIYSQDEEWAKFKEIYEWGDPNMIDLASSIVGTWKVYKNGRSGNMSETEYYRFKPDGTSFYIKIREKETNNNYIKEEIIKGTWNVSEGHILISKKECYSKDKRGNVSFIDLGGENGNYSNYEIAPFCLTESFFVVQENGYTDYYEKVSNNVILEYMPPEYIDEGDNQGSETSKSRLLTIHYDNGTDAKYKMDDISSISITPKQNSSEDGSAVKLEYGGTSMTLSLGQKPQIVNEGDNIILKTSSMTVTLSVPCKATFVGVSDTSIDKVVLRNNEEDKPIDVFTIDGKKVTTLKGKDETLSLEKGVYIINGKKMIIK